VLRAGCLVRCHVPSASVLARDAWSLKSRACSPSSLEPEACSLLLL